MRVLTAEQMMRVDKTTIEAGTPGLTLMQTAGKAVYDMVIDIPGIGKDSVITVIAGKGNNGGDGFHVADLLVQNGYTVSALLLSEMKNVGGDAATCMNAALESEVKIVTVTDSWDIDVALSQIHNSDAIVDAIFGTGLKGEVEGSAAELIAAVNESEAYVVSVDIPSGVNATTGEASKVSVMADATQTFGALKVGHVNMPGKDYCGHVDVADIGFPDEIMNSVEPFCYALTDREAAELIPRRAYNAHKGAVGRVFILAGSVGMTGAAAMSGRAALRAGAGLVTVGCPASLNDILEVKLTEVMTVPLPEVRKKRCLSLQALGMLREKVKKATVVAVGPGLGTYHETSELIRRFLSTYEGKVVLDADGVNAFKNSMPLLKSATCDLILTPHAGELSVLTGKSIEEILSDPVSAAREPSIATDAVVLLKGAPTVIAKPDGAIWLNTTGNEGMATAGMGDVLTGVIAGFAAQGLELFDSAILGAYIHGLAGDLATSEIGVHSLLAGDVLETLPDAFFNLTLNL